MSIFDNIETSDLLSRYHDLIKRYAEMAKELAPKLDKFGKYRQELQEITVEFLNRGVKPEDPTSLVEVIQQEIDKRQIPQDGQIEDPSKRST